MDKAIINKFASSGGNNSVAIEYNGIMFRSKLELEWYQFMCVNLPKARIVYEPCTFKRTPINPGKIRGKVWEPTYTPDFVLMPRVSREPTSTRAKLRAYRRIGIFCEAKPDKYDLFDGYSKLENQDINNIHFVETNIMLLLGYPISTSNGPARIVVVRTDGKPWSWVTRDYGLDFEAAMTSCKISVAQWKNEEIAMSRLSEIVEKISY